MWPRFYDMEPHNELVRLPSTIHIINLYEPYTYFDPLKSYAVASLAGTTIGLCVFDIFTCLHIKKYRCYYIFTVKILYSDIVCGIQQYLDVLYFQ